MSDIVKKALELYKRDEAAWRTIYEKAREDLYFLSDEPGAQWETRAYQARINSGRFAIEIDQLGQFINQTVNDIRMNTPTIKVVPDGNEASQESAEVFQGLIRNIEYQSNADTAYDTAVEFSIKSSFGWIRVENEYEDDESFNQRLCIKRVVNTQAIILDSESIEADGSDAMHGFVLDKISVDKFKKDFPKFDPVSFESDDRYKNKPLNPDDIITICEFFKIEEQERSIGLLEDGSTEEVIQGKQYVQTRAVTKRIVKRYKLSGKDVLEETVFPGRYIPIIPVYGQEAWENGERKINSLIRKSKVAQMMFNLWKSLETELLVRQPRAQFLAPVGQTEDFIDDYQNADKATVLRYNSVDENQNQLAPPQVIPPPQPPVGMIQAARSAVDDIKATMGMYNASIGARSNETSGVAIQARKLEGDVATYHFGDNLTKSISQLGRVLVFAIPDVYDTARILRIIGEEEDVKEVGVNGEITQDQEETIDLRRGRYAVKVITGPSFTTRRQEALAYLTEAFKANPQLMQIAGDLYFKYSDFPGAEALANRIKKTIPPELVADEEDQDPEKMAMQQTIEQGKVLIQQMEGQMQVMQQELDNKQNEFLLKAKSEQNDSEIDRMKIEIEVQKLELERYKLDIEAAKVANDMKIKQQELEAQQVIASMMPQEIPISGIGPSEGLATSEEGMIL